MPDLPHIEGIYETHLPVAALAPAVAFYRDVVGLELAREFADRRIAFFWINGKANAMLGLWETGTGPLKMRLHIAFRLTKAELLRAPEHLQQHGVAVKGFHGEPVGEPIVIGWMPALSLYFSDPDGHSIEYLCMLDEEPDDSFGMRSYSEWLARYPAR